MNKAMNKLLLQMVQYDLGSGLFISLIIGIISTFINAGSYLAGISVATINYFVSGYVILNYLGKGKKQLLIIVSNFLRIGIYNNYYITICKKYKFYDILYYRIYYTLHYGAYSF